MIPDEEVYAPFWGHVDELRRAFLRALSIIIAGMLISFAFYDPLIAFLTHPLSQHVLPLKEGLLEETLEHVRLSNALSIEQTVILPAEALPPINLSSGILETAPQTYLIPPKGHLTYAKRRTSTGLVVLGPLEGMLTALKTSAWVGVVATSPFWLFALMQFVAPALQRKEKRLLLPFLLSSLLLISVGFAFALLVTIPFANRYLLAFNQTMGINLWTLTHYLDYTLFLLLANGLAFELFAVGL